MSTWITPSANRLVIGSPAWRNTVSIGRLWARVSATKRSIPRRPGPFDELGHEQRAQTVTLPVVRDHERHLGRLLAGEPIEARHGHDLAVDGRHQRLAGPVVDVGEPVQLGVAELGWTLKKRR